MKILKLITGITIPLIVISLCSCAVEIPLHGDITGIVTDAENSQPIQDAFVELHQSYDTIDIDTTLIDGSYHLSNIQPGDYGIKAYKPAFEKETKNDRIWPIPDLH